MCTEPSERDAVSGGSRRHERVFTTRHYSLADSKSSDAVNKYLKELAFCEHRSRLTSGGGCSISTAEVDEDGWSSLHFSQDDCSEMPTASDTIAPVLDESNSVPTVKLENGEYCEQLEDSGYNEQFVNEVNVKNNDYGEYGKPREHV
ncbi:hypothetical protein PC118_g17535 [Phytophthora cactorum]|uniref:Uncharacterized protein n=1 Tax=Phytophthora cactorum TaxID=29920 RepID=A0A8T1B816_9STRA|nr:hypothetical protein PC112_g15472 [Phytophthora cactorum]KAG2897172.1 hypothetical protein PC115_g17290 [Phytophthora cactorum]KAG2969281.1 hypothetical protein PC118_g17535 [Phytophthora cactorum]